MLLATPVAFLGLYFAGCAFRRPGDMETLLGLFLIGAIAGAVVQFGSLLGLWAS